MGILTSVYYYNDIHLNLNRIHCFKIDMQPLTYLKKLDNLIPTNVTDHNIIKMKHKVFCYMQFNIS